MQGLVRVMTTTRRGVAIYRLVQVEDTLCRLVGRLRTSYRLTEMEGEGRRLDITLYGCNSCVSWVRGDDDDLYRSVF
jgi:hypothetical protein